MTLNNLVFFCWGPHRNQALVLFRRQKYYLKKTLHVRSNEKMQNFFIFFIFHHFPSFSHLIFHLLPCTNFTPKSYIFGTCFRHLACVFFIVLTHLQQKKTQPFQIVPYLSITFCFFRSYYLCSACSLFIQLVPFCALKGTSHLSAFPYLSIFN